jgi:hypothetical protein
MMLVPSVARTLLYLCCAAAYCHTSSYKVLLSVATSNKKAMYASCLAAKKIAVGECRNIFALQLCKCTIHLV